MAAIDPPGRSTRPMEPAKSRSPENSTSPSPAGSGSPKTTEPALWPGVCRTAKSSPASATVSPSASSRTSSGSAKVSWPYSGVPTGRPTPDHGSRSWPRSAGWMRAGTSRAWHTGSTEKVWSKCPCVSSTATGCNRCSAMTSSSCAVIPMPGSMTTHCSPSAGATTQQLVAVASDGKPAMSTARHSN